MLLLLAPGNDRVRRLDHARATAVGLVPAVQRALAARLVGAGLRFILALALMRQAACHTPSYPSSSGRRLHDLMPRAPTTG